MKITKDMLSNELKETEKINELEKQKTIKKKKEFINEIKSGLGKEIKQNPSAVKIIKKPWYNSFFVFLKKIFTKF